MLKVLLTSSCDFATLPRVFPEGEWIEIISSGGNETLSWLNSTLASQALILNICTATMVFGASAN